MATHPRPNLRGTLLVVAVVALASTGCAFVQRVSVDGDGNESFAGAALATPAISTDGRYVAFVSQSSDLAPGGTPNRQHVYVRDLADGTTERVSVDSDGNEADDDSSGLVSGFGPDAVGSPSISGDGRYVAFHSSASNLVPDDTNGMLDVFVRDRVDGTTERVSIDDDGNQMDQHSFHSSISGDGRRVAFVSGTSTGPGPFSDVETHVFVRDRVAGTTQQVSEPPLDPEQGVWTHSPAIARFGEFVAFERGFTADGASLPPHGEVLRGDVLFGGAELVSRNNLGQPADGPSGEPSISPNGEHVVFSSEASNLAAGTSEQRHVYVREIIHEQPETTSRVSPGTADGDSFSPSISGDGRYVAFASHATNVVPDDTNDAGDVFVRDRVFGSFVRVSVDLVGQQADSESFRPSMSADARYVAFGSAASNLVPDDTNDASDVFVVTHPRPVVTAVAPSSVAPGTTTPIVISGSDFLFDTVVAVKNPSEGVSLSNVRFESLTMRADLTVDPDAPPGARNLWVGNLGTGPGPLTGAWDVCVGCITVE